MATNPAEFTISPYGRGPCSVCGRNISLTKKGAVRVHGAKAVGVWPPMNCAGSGEPPTDLTAVSNAD
jgi:hypothetical protein